MMRRSANLLCGVTVAVLLAATAAFADDPLAREMLEEVNLARTAPQRYADLLRSIRQNFTGNWYRVPGSFTLVQTKEGVQAVDEAIRFVASKTPLKPLAWSSGLAKAAEDLVRDQGKSGDLGHTGGRSGGVRDRIEKHGVWKSKIAENIAYGATTARLMVMQLIVDDGVADRGHRTNIFTHSFTVAGAACGEHALYGSMCVMDFADAFKP